MQSKEQTYIKFILEQLQIGATSFERTFELFLTKFNCSRPTFSKYWKIANKQYLDSQILIENQKTKEYTEAELKRNNDLILTREKILEMQSNVVKLAYNEVANTKGKEPNKISAFNYSVERLNKMQGYDAPTKSETEIKIPTNITIE